MKLKEYRDKRDVSLTNEPFGADPAEPAPTHAGAFVVHQHAATRMHWDLRIEIAGVLASFAVPHGVTLDPAARHLAVHTEDHPIEYLDFEAVIPVGTYGAGAMILWDVGRIQYLETTAEEGILTGKLDFLLHGHKLNGRFALVRMKPKGRTAPDNSREWLLLKKRDAFSKDGQQIVVEQPRSVLSGLTVEELANAAERAVSIEKKGLSLAKKVAGKSGLPPRFDVRSAEPMLCLAGELPTARGWVFELKMDGVRCLASKTAAEVYLRYRTGRPATDTYPEIARAVGALPPSDLVLDGEIVAFDETGKPHFQRLGRRIHVQRARDIRRLMVEVPVVFVVFDLLQIGGANLSGVPFRERKKLLAELIPSPGILRVLDHLEGDGNKILEFCRQQHLEGVVAKRVEGPYRPGPHRSGDWIKKKVESEDDFVIVGFTKGESGRRIGALDIASYVGNNLTVRGKVGSGLSEHTIDDLLPRLTSIKTKKPTAHGRLLNAPKGRTHVKPELVCRVRYLAFSDDGHARFPVFLGMRDDVTPRECHANPHGQDGAPPEIDEAEGVTDNLADPTSSKPLGGEGGIQVAITNRKKIFWRNEGYTKGDLIDYYEAVSSTLLPYLEKRPIMLVRYPDGIDGKSFYQWNVPHGMPKWVTSIALAKHAIEVRPEDANKHVFIIDRPESLLYIANLACIPVHILASRIGSPDRADFLTIDFDINRGSFVDAVTLALTLRALLTEMGLSGFPKTSGQTGLHVFVPLWETGVSPRAARTLADLLGRLIVERHSEIATMERSVPKRGNRVYVDTGQTGPSRTIVAPYSVRATPGARVSTPLIWDEVKPDLDPAAFTIRTVPSRIVDRGDPMAPMRDVRPDIGAVMRVLEAMAGPGR